MRINKKYFPALLIFLIFLTNKSSAQTTDSLLTDLSIKWSHAKTYALSIASLMPDSAYNFKPVPEEMSFGGQLLHIAANINWLRCDYLFGTKMPDVSNAKPFSKKEIMQIVSDAYDSGYAAQQRLPIKQLDDTVPFFAGPKTRRQIVILLHDHQSHHIGQLIVYLRLQGIKPPDYVGW